MTGAFAIIGGINAAYMTGYVNPYWCFGIYTAFCFVVFITAYCMDPKLEYESELKLEQARQDEVNNGDTETRTTRRNCCQELSHNFKIMKEMLKLSIYWRVILFFVLFGLTIPNFDDFLYYWKLDVANLT